MSKLAIFTEGQGDQLFTSRLLRELAGAKGINLELITMFGGRRFERSILKMETVQAKNDTHYFAQIVDCGTDGRVVSEINDQYETLVAAGFSVIVGMRDVRPDFRRDEIAQAQQTMMGVLRKEPIVPVLVLATMELEAWFLAEIGHFSRLNAALTNDRIRAALNLDIQALVPEDRDNPTDDLAAIYALEGLVYSKAKADVNRTIDALDFPSIPTRVRIRAPSISPLIDAANAFLA